MTTTTTPSASPTPETDAFYREHPIDEYEQTTIEPGYGGDWLDFARSLERRLQIEQEGFRLCAEHYEELEAENSELRQRAEAAEHRASMSGEEVREIDKLRQQLACEHDFKYQANPAGSSPFNRCNKCGYSKSLG